MLAVVASKADLEVVANFSKLGAATAVAFWFLGYFESALWVALVALMIPIVDSYSVWRGPTHHIISERPEVFTALSFSFPLPGERQAFLVWGEPLAGDGSFDVYRTPGGKRNDEPLRDENDNGQIGFLEAELDADRDYTYRVVTRGAENGSATIVARADDANEGEQHGDAVSSRFAPTDLRVDSVDSSAKLGLPDLLFFALFLGAADRFRLRVPATWVAMTALVRPHARRDVLLRRQRPPRAPAARARLPRRERRPALARVPDVARGRAGAPGSRKRPPIGSRQGKTRLRSVLRLRGRTGLLEQRDALDVRRVREHVDRPRAAELVAPVLAAAS